MRTTKITPGSNLRWESSRMILPEHKQALLEYRKAQNKKKKPEIDEQQWEEFEWTMQEAKEDGEMLRFTFWEDGDFCEVMGYFFINESQKQFHVEYEEEVFYIPFDSIVSIDRI